MSELKELKEHKIINLVDYLSDDWIERMFANEPDARNLMLKNIVLSYVLLHGDLECANRFYLEDKAIGELYPLFNIDIER